MQVRAVVSHDVDVLSGRSHPREDNPRSVRGPGSAGCASRRRLRRSRSRIGWPPSTGTSRSDPFASVRMVLPSGDQRLPRPTCRSVSDRSISAIGVDDHQRNAARPRDCAKEHDLAAIRRVGPGRVLPAGRAGRHAGEAAAIRSANGVDPVTGGIGVVPAFARQRRPIGRPRSSSRAFRVGSGLSNRTKSEPSGFTRPKKINP